MQSKAKQCKANNAKQNNEKHLLQQKDTPTASFPVKKPFFWA